MFESLQIFKPKLETEPIDQNKRGLKQVWLELKIFFQNRVHRRDSQHPTLADKSKDVSVVSPPTLPDVPNALINEAALGTESDELTPAQEYLYQLGQQQLKPLSEMLGIPGYEERNIPVLADLIANNRIQAETENRIKSLHLNGNLFGVGTASIFALLEGFDNCLSFNSFDIHPIPVALGRTITELLVENDTFEKLIIALSQGDEIRKKLENFGLPEKYLDRAVQGVAQAVVEFNLTNCYHPNQYPRIVGLHINYGDRINLLPLLAIKIYYQKLRSLAINKKMNFIQQDFFAPDFWDDFTTSYPETATGQNLVYGSNGIEHVVRSKFVDWQNLQEQGRQSWIDQEKTDLATLINSNFLSWTNSFFVFTLSSLDYNLLLSSTPPIFDINKNYDVIFKD